MSESSIPSVRLDNAAVWEVVHPRLKELVSRGDFTLGKELREFEDAAAKAFGCLWAVGTSSGTSALTLSLKAAPIGPRARVALPANTFFATFEAVVLAGCVPVVVDHDEDFLLDLEALESLDVSAVIPVHLYGLPVDMDALTRMAHARGWWVLEDCSQAHGATVGSRPVGSFGHAGAFSAYPTKNLGAWGDAGFITGSDPQLERRLRSLRHHGQGVTNVHDEIGATDRLDTLQALVLLEKLKRLPEEIEARRRVASWYRESLAGLQVLLPDDRGSRTHAFHQFVIRVPDRDQVREHLAKQGVGVGVHYPTPVHQQPAAGGQCVVPQRPRRAEEWSRSILSLPIYPSLTRDDVQRVASALTAAVR
jgi:dTDP-4-amino-4,6-dideoxygalactose transaminase